MRRVSGQLPNRFPIGTRFVIEGSHGRIRLRYLEFPDGRQVDLLPVNRVPGDQKAKPRAIRGRRNGRRRQFTKMSVETASGRNRNGSRGLS
jgi:hypothetical protein